MTWAELYWAAMYISGIWYFGYEYAGHSKKTRLYCRTRAVVLHDRIINQRVEPVMEEGAYA